MLQENIEILDINTSNLVSNKETILSLASNVNDINLLIQNTDSILNFVANFINKNK